MNVRRTSFAVTENSPFLLVWCVCSRVVLGCDRRSMHYVTSFRTENVSFRRIVSWHEVIEATFGVSFESITY